MFLVPFVMSGIVSVRAQWFADLEAGSAGGQNVSWQPNVTGRLQRHDPLAAQISLSAFDEKARAESDKRERERWATLVKEGTNGRGIDVTQKISATTGPARVCLACREQGHSDKACAYEEELDEALATLHGVIDRNTLRRVVPSECEWFEGAAAELEAYKQREYVAFGERETGVCEFCRAVFDSAGAAAAHKRTPNKCPVRILAAVTVRVALSKPLDDFAAREREVADNAGGKARLAGTKRSLEAVLGNLRKMTADLELLGEQCQALKEEQVRIAECAGECERLLKRGKK